MVSTVCLVLLFGLGVCFRYVSWLGLNDEELEYACSFLPATCGLGLLLVVPWIFLLVATTYESYKTKVGVDIIIFKRYFGYYMVRHLHAQTPVSQPPRLQLSAPCRFCLTPLTNSFFLCVTGLALRPFHLMAGIHCDHVNHVRCDRLHQRLVGGRHRQPRRHGASHRPGVRQGLGLLHHGEAELKDTRSSGGYTWNYL